MGRGTRLVLVAVIVAVAMPSAAHALIKKLIPLRDVISAEPMIFVVTVEKLLPEKPAAVFNVSETLKGKVPFASMPVRLTGDAEGQREKQPAELLKRLKAGLPIVIFAHKQGDQTLGFAYTEGTWFQLSGRGESEDKLVWTFNHFEPYFRRTFKGTTAELKQVVKDGLDGKPVPAPNEKEPPGLGPEVKPDDKPPPAPPGVTTVGGGGLAFAVVPTFVLIGPLAILAALFPTVFGGLALLMKRWVAALSISSLVSTVYFARMWFVDRLGGSWWGGNQAQWLVLTGIAAAGSIWAGMRFRKAIREADFETFEPRKWDFLGLAVLSIAGAGGIGYALFKRENLLLSPWLDFVVSTVPVWVATVALISVRGGPERTVAFSLESAFLWGLTFSCGAVVALQQGRSESTGPAIVSSGRLAKPAWGYELSGGGVVLATPVQAGDRVYGAGVLQAGFKQTGIVFALDRATGTEVWRFDDGDNLKSVFCSPLLVGDRLYIGEGFHEDRDCRMLCLNSATGEKIWEFKTTSHTESTPTFADGKLYFGAGDDGIYCIDAASGEKIWQFRERHVDAPPAIHQGRLYVGSGVGDLHKTTELLCLNAATGERLWVVPVELPAFAPPILADNHVYFGFGNGNFSGSAEKPMGGVICVDATTGQRLWQFDAADTILGQPAVDSTHVYFASLDHHVYSVVRQTGRLRWKKSLGSPVFASVVIAGKEGEAVGSPSLYVATTGGRIACLDAAGGKIIWMRDLEKAARQEFRFAEVPSVTINSLAVHEDGDRRRILCGATGKNDIKTLGRVYVLDE